MAKPDPIRPLYDQLGVEGYYRAHGHAYTNPHFSEIETLLLRHLPRIDTRKVLDFCAGSGEVTRILQAAGVEQLTGSDPFTGAAYEEATGLPCEPWSFADVAREGVPAGFSTVICSFALHLCPQELLFSVAWRLLEAASALIVITPHKRPALEVYPAFELVWEETESNARGKRVRMKCYGIKKGSSFGVKPLTINH